MAILRMFTLAHDSARAGVSKFSHEAPAGTNSEAVVLAVKAGLL